MEKNKLFYNNSIHETAGSEGYHITTNKQSRSRPTHKKTIKRRDKETRKQKKTEKLRKLEWLEISNLAENRDTAVSFSKFDGLKLKYFHNTV